MTGNWDQQRQKALERDNYTCQHCDSGRRNDSAVGLQVHHIKRRKAGGSDDLENLVTLCKRCHNRLHSISEGDIRDPSLLEGADLRGNPEVVWDVFLTEIEETGGGRLNPLLIREKTGFSKGSVSQGLQYLQAAGKVEKVSRGLYQASEKYRK